MLCMRSLDLNIQTPVSFLGYNIVQANIQAQPSGMMILISVCLTHQKNKTRRKIFKKF